MDTPVLDVTADEAADLLRDPYPIFGRRRAETSGVFLGSVMDWTKTPEEFRPENLYAAVSFDAVNRVFRDSKLFNSHIYDSTIGLFMGPTILAMEGKKHREHRNLVSAAFKSRSLLQWEPEIVRPVVNALIDEFVDAGEADLVRDFTLEFPTRVISKLLGLPEEDLAHFRKRAVDLISYHVKYKRAFEASAALKDYFLTHIEKRRSQPTEDIIGDLVSAEIDGERLSDEAIYSFLRLLLPAGLETTYRSSGNLLFLLLTHPEQFPAVQADRELIGPAIEEGLRFETPLTTVQRYTAEETELEGVTLPEGAVIDVCIGSANRDENRWERSEEFDIFRKRLPHISFAAGEHTCLGLHLARMETRVALECLLDRLTDIKLVTDDNPRIYGQPFRSPTALPVRVRRSGVIRHGQAGPGGEQRRRRERGSINADEIVTGAFEVAAEVSLDNLSMPMLAKHLGVGVTSLYWYFRKKDDLLDAMADRALHEYNYTDPSIDAENWRESLRKHAQTMRQTFHNDPVLCDLILIRGTYSRGAARNALEKIESPVAALVQAGLSPKTHSTPTRRSPCTPVARRYWKGCRTRWPSRRPTATG